MIQRSDQPRNHTHPLKRLARIVSGGAVKSVKLEQPAPQPTLVLTPVS
jgi:hypothetical protein